MKTLAIIGSTGSIGKSSLNVFKKNKKKFKLFYLSCNKNFNLLNKQIKKYNPKFFFINDKFLAIKYKNNKKVKSIDFLIKKNKKIDYVISGVSGFESVQLNFKLLKISKNLLIANKETIICGGNIFLKEAKKNSCNLIPIDSEHFCINYFLKNFKHKHSDIEKFFLMASGGPFLLKKPSYKEKLSNVLNHPNWKMGKKITVDSSTMANKVLELFEANILFKIPDNKIDIMIEKKSIIHSAIVMKNNIHFYIAHKTSMQVPISSALKCKNDNVLNISKIPINIQKINLKQFPLVKLGYKILKYGHSGMILFTVINQKLVEQFIVKKIYFGDITLKLINIFKKNEIVKISKKCIKNKSDIYKIINLAKKIKV